MVVLAWLGTVSFARFSNRGNIGTLCSWHGLREEALHSERGAIVVSTITTHALPRHDPRVGRMGHQTRARVVVTELQEAMRLLEAGKKLGMK